MSIRALALTLDLDGPAEYARLHGLSSEADDPLVMYRGPLARFVTLCESLGAVGTVYAIGRDVDAGGGPMLAALTQRGFEIGAHSYSHDYGMADNDVPFIYDDIARARRSIEGAVGRPPQGFRAPGYLLSTVMLDALEALAFTYDSSVLPSPSYYAVKLAVLARYKLAGRKSASSWKTPRLGLAPVTPYHPSVRPYGQGNRRIVELPIAVTTAARLPMTAAALVLAPKPLRALMLSGLARRDVIVINVHAMDLADPRSDELPPELLPFQPELRIPIEERLERLRASLADLLHDRAALTCGAVARAFAE